MILIEAENDFRNVPNIFDRAPTEWTLNVWKWCNCNSRTWVACHTNIALGKNTDTPECKLFSIEFCVCLKFLNGFIHYYKSLYMCLWSLDCMLNETLISISNRLQTVIENMKAIQNMLSASRSNIWRITVHECLSISYSSLKYRIKIYSIVITE